MVLNKLDGVLGSAITGLRHDDFGESVCAAIVPRFGADLDGREVVARLKSTLASFKVPEWICCQGSLARNAMGKVQKNMRRDQFSRFNGREPSAML